MSVITLEKREPGIAELHTARYPGGNFAVLHPINPYSPDSVRVHGRILRRIIKEASVVLGISVQTIGRLINRGDRVTWKNGVSS